MNTNGIPGHILGEEGDSKIYQIFSLVFCGYRESAPYICDENNDEFVLMSTRNMCNHELLSTEIKITTDAQGVGGGDHPVAQKYGLGEPFYAHADINIPYALYGICLYGLTLILYSSTCTLYQWHYKGGRVCVMVYAQVYIIIGVLYNVRCVYNSVIVY